MNRKELKQKANEQLKGNIFTMLKPIIITVIIMAALSLTVEMLAKVIGIPLETKELAETLGVAVEVSHRTMLGNVVDILEELVQVLFNVGVTAYVLKFIRKEEYSINTVFDTIKKSYQLIIPVFLLVWLNMTIGFLLLIIPGIIAYYGLCMYQYVLVDNPTLTTKEILVKSWNLMKGHKFELFQLQLSFFWWCLSCVFIIPIFYVIPYMNLTFANYYEELIKENKEKVSE